MTESTKAGIELIAEERNEQIVKHGWSASHDATHKNGELAKVSATILAMGTDMRTICPDGEYGSDNNPWGLIEKLKNDRIHQLKVAGALCAAEIDRLLTQNQ